ncbi:beta-lactamase [Erythrobacter longus]|uniref:Beta-lactamase n=1 Tax=Erythrobacter longus TaxID=1044 RepID=A0A074M9Z2_ERYLO|nr:serine hydrolase [Erythrobacter longus]KEO91606.1 beta-lactamase [Erythrobacter longus]
MRKAIFIVLALLVLGASVVWFSFDKDARDFLAKGQTSPDVLFWSVDERDAGFRVLDAFPFLAGSRTIEAGDEPLPLPQGEPVDIGVDIARYMADQRASALVIVHEGKVVFEDYGLDFSADGKWTSFSVAKSLTSTLVGAAVADGSIASIDDPVTKYIADLKGSAYDDVSVAQLLTMTSGVQWNEDYGDPNSDVAKFNNHTPEGGMDTTVSYMRSLPREAPAGEKWVYKTGETNLIGILVSEATGKPLADYLSEKIWKPFGMGADATWLLNNSGNEISGCCIQAATRDMARFGLFMLGGGRINGEAVLPEGWIEAATTQQADIGTPGEGYGYQWWTYDDGSYAAQGIFGQGIFIDPSRDLVIASNANWPEAVPQKQAAARLEFYRAVQRAIAVETDAGAPDKTGDVAQ